MENIKYKVYYKADGKFYPWVDGSGKAKVFGEGLGETLDEIRVRIERGQIESFRLVRIP